MCICTITTAQLAIDLEPEPKVTTNDNPMFIPTVDEFKAAVEMTLRDSEWFKEMVEEYASDNLEQAIDEDVDRKLERHFRNFDITDYVDFDDAVGDAVDSAMENIDFDYKVERYMDNNFDPEDYVDNAVREYCNRLDVDAVASEEVHDILTDTDFINALALAIVNVRKQQAAERKAKREHLFQTGQFLGNVQATNQGDTNASM
jgi:hypothetical protein